MRSGVAGELLDFSDVVAAYASFAGDRLCAESSLRDVRRTVYKRRLYGFAQRFSDLLTVDDLADRLSDSTQDVVSIYEHEVNLGQVNAEAGLEFIASVSHLHIPFVEHPPFFKTKDACEQAVMDNPFILSEIPPELRTYKAIAAAISNAGMALGWLDVNSRSYALCVDALRSYPEAISLIQTFLMTPEIVRLAMLGNPHFAIRHIPIELLDRDTIMEVLKAEPTFLLTLAGIDGAEIDDEMVILAVSMIPSLLLMLPRSLMTKEVFAALLELHPELVSIVPVEMLTEEIAAMVVSKKPELIEKIPREIRGVKVCAAYAEHYSRGFSRYFSRSVIDAYKAKRPAITLSDEIGNIPASIKIVRISQKIKT